LLFVLSPVVAVASEAIPAAAQAAGRDAQPARIMGRVIDHETRRPILGALITIESAEARAITDERGSFVLDRVAPGTIALTVEMLGYAKRTDSITLRGGAVHDVEIALGRQAIALAPLAVSVRSGWLEARGFYEREQSASGGHFFTREEIDARRTQALTDLLAEVPGVRLHYLDAGRKHVRFGRGATNDIPAFDPRQARALPGCEPDLYLDGTLFRERIPRDGTENRVDGFDIIEASQVEGIEVYIGANTPLQYQHSCGVILVWTRRGSGPAPAMPAVAVEPNAALPELAPGTRLRVTLRTGRRALGRVGLVTADSLVLDDHSEPRLLAIDEIRSIQRSTGTASVLERSWRGARWGMVIGLVGIALSAAAEEFSELGNAQTGKISDWSPRKPAFGIKVVTGTTLTGALLGGAFWRYDTWADVNLR
jgi:hypothetical protein